MTHKKRHIATESEITAGTGKSIEAWAELVKQKVAASITPNQLAVHLIDEFKLPIFWAHTIAYRLIEGEQNGTQEGLTASDCLTPRLGV